MRNRTGRTLVLDCHRAALETAQSLGRAGVVCDLIAGSSDCLAFRSRYVNEKLVRDFAAPLLPTVQELDAKHRYDLIVPSTEPAMLHILRLPEAHDLRVRSVVASNASFEIALSKARTTELAQQLGIPVPASGPPENFPAGSPFPRVLKPVHSSVSVDGEMRQLVPAIVTDADARERALERLSRYGGVIEQEYVPGLGVGIELLFEHGQPRWHFAHERVHELPLTGGASTYRRSIAMPADALDFSIRLLQALHWHGVAMVEFKRRASGEFVLIEINPRLWGSLALAVDAGVDFPRALFSIATGQQLPPQPNYRTNYFSRALPKDVLWMGANTFANRGNPLLLTRPRLGSVIEYLRPLICRESWDHFDWSDAGVNAQLVSSTVQTLVKYGSEALQRRLARRGLGAHHRKVVERLRFSAAPRIVFLCYGNICRSPFAAEAARNAMPNAHILSAGFHRREERRSPTHIREIGRELGLNLETHRSRRFVEDDLRNADLILLMDAENFAMLRREAPWALERATLLGFFAGEGNPEIEDPYEMSVEQTRPILSRTQAAVNSLAELAKLITDRATEALRKALQNPHSFARPLLVSNW
jgi:protein-tyrosine-phosphatase/predicted ATP-grasp superfamily ATP-dependent carboligase